MLEVGYGIVDPELIVFPRVDGVEPPAGYAGLQRLPVRETVQQLAVNTPEMAIPEFKKYPELLRSTCRRLGWNLSEFDVYRLRLPLPGETGPDETGPGEGAAESPAT